VFWPSFNFPHLFEVFCKSLFASVLQFFIDYMSYYATSSGIFSDRSTYWWDKIPTILVHMSLGVCHFS